MVSTPADTIGPPGGDGAADAAAPERNPLRWSDAVLTILLGQIGAIAIVGLWPAGDGLLAQSRATAAVAGSALAYIVACAWVLRRHGWTWRDFGLRPAAQHWFVGAVAFAALFAVLWGAFGAQLVGDQRETGTKVLDTLMIAPRDSLALALLSVIVAAPLTAFAEEITFRGLIYRLLRQRAGVALSVGISAAVFSGIHLYFLLGGALGLLWTAQALVVGAVLALIYELSGSLWPGITLHTTNNLIAMVPALLALV
jgi:membrane protease YdiL (CAAX protease family)